MAPRKKPDKVADAAQLLASVNSALATQKEKTVFAIGGSISPTGQRPNVLRWDSDLPANHSRSVSLPVPDDAPSKEAFSKLLVDCAPATFGQGKKKVLDETYRKASKMDPAKFSLDFNLYEHGILEAITQALVHENYRGLRAELYSLNVRCSSFDTIVVALTITCLRRSTPRLRASFDLTLTRLDLSFKWARWWYASRSNTKVCPVLHPVHICT